MIIPSKLIRTLTLLCILAFAITFLRFRGQLAEGDARLHQLREQQAELEIELSNREEDYAYRQSDEYVIRVAREELGMVFPGEIRFVSQ